MFQVPATLVRNFICHHPPSARGEARVKDMNVLHVEDDLHDAELIHALITGEWPDTRLTCVSTRDAFIRELETRAYDIILSDFALPGFDGMESLTIAKDRVPDTPFIFVSGTIGEDRAIEAVRLGADDYVLKDQPKRLLMALPRALVAAADRRERRDAEARIREQAEMLNQAREAIYITDPSGRVIYWNAGAERTFGWTAAEAVGLGIQTLVKPAEPADLDAARATTATDGQWMGELPLHNRAGDLITIEARQTLIRDEAGGTKALLCIGTDITDRKRLEEQFLRAQRMENLGLLAAGIAHDLNNMLAPILLATPMLREQVADASALNLLDTLERSAERGAQLVRQILSFAHGVAGEHHIVQVKHLLRDVESVVGGTFPKSIRLEENVPSDLWPVSGNPTQIHQVLMNLCVNARDAMPGGGTLSIKAENRIIDPASAARIPGGRAGPFLVVDVADTGTGIAPEILARIWEPFFTTKETGRGTGLGLSTVRGIVQAHQGFTEVVSTVGQGTVFRVFFPAAPGTLPAAASSKLQALPPGHGELILVVDDEAQIRETISQILGRQGYRVLLACDGAEATAIFAQRAGEIRLVISDLHMPNLDGAKLGRALRQINPAARMLVVSGMASGLGDRVDIRPDEFADALLLKPFKAETLLETVHRLLTRGRAGSGTA